MELTHRALKWSYYAQWFHNFYAKDSPNVTQGPLDEEQDRGEGVKVLRPSSLLADAQANGAENGTLRSAAGTSATPPHHGGDGGEKRDGKGSSSSNGSSNNMNMHQQQGRVSWNLAGLLQPPPATPTTPHGGTEHGTPPSLPPPIPHHHYPSHYHTHPHHATPSHYPHHLLPPPQPTEATPWVGVASQMQHIGVGVPSSISEGGVAATDVGGSTNGSYKMDAEIHAMYYPHHNSGSPTVTEATSSSATNSVTSNNLNNNSSNSNNNHTSSPSISVSSSTSAAVTTSSTTNTDPLNNFQTLGATIDPQDVMNQVLGSYFEESPWIDPNQSGNHGQLTEGGGYPPEYGLARPSYTDRKKKIIKEWNKSNNSPASSANSPAAAAAFAAESAARAAAISAASTYPSNPPADIFYPHPYIKDESYTYGPHYVYNDVNLVNPYVAHQMAANAAASSVAAAAVVANRADGTVTSSGRGRKRKNQNNTAPHAAASVSSNGSGSQGLSRDERKAVGLSLPISCSDIINLPMDEFNDLLSKHELTEEQLTLCRDIRRRGKNKVAARNCRKRKIDQIKQLEDDVTRIRCRKTELINEHEKLQAQRRQWADLVKRLHDYVLKELGHDPNHWQFQMDINRQIHILPRSQSDENDPSKHPRPYHYAPSVGPPLMESTHIPTT